MLFTGFLSLLDFDVIPEVEPFQTTAPTTQFNVGRVAVGSGYGVVSDEFAELGAESTVGRTARFDFSQERLFLHSARSGYWKACQISINRSLGHRARGSLNHR